MFENIGWAHRRSVVITDEGQYHHQWLHRQNVESLERWDRGVHPHPVRTHLHRALHASPREKVSEPCCRAPATAGPAFVHSCSQKVLLKPGDLIQCLVKHKPSKTYINTREEMINRSRSMRILNEELEIESCISKSHSLHYFKANSVTPWSSLPHRIISSFVNATNFYSFYQITF